MDIHQAALGALPQTQHATPHGASAARFAAYLNQPDAAYTMDRYVAPPDPARLPHAPFLRQASEVSHRLHTALTQSPPPVIGEDGEVSARDVIAAMRHAESTALAQMQFSLQTKVVELGTSNLRTLYQMQG